MAIDYGKKRVGVASTDESGGFSIPRAVWPNDKNLLSKVMEFVKKEKIEKIVIGNSKNFDGEPNQIAGEIENFKQALEDLRIETAYHTEILTTMEARQIQGNNAMTDASAAALILKSYLDSLNQE